MTSQPKADPPVLQAGTTNWLAEVSEADYDKGVGA